MSWREQGSSCTETHAFWVRICLPGCVHELMLPPLSTEVPDACSSPQGAHILTSVLGIRCRRSEAVGPEPSRTRLFYVLGPWREMEWDIQDSVVARAGRWCLLRGGFHPTRLSKISCGFSYGQRTTVLDQKAGGDMASATIIPNDLQPNIFLRISLNLGSICLEILTSKSRMLPSGKTVMLPLKRNSNAWPTNKKVNSSVIWVLDL